MKCKLFHISNPNLFLTLMIVVILIAPTYSASAPTATTPPWFFKGAVFNYSWSTMVMDNNKSNVTNGNYSVEFLAVFNQSNTYNYEYEMWLDNGTQKTGGFGSINNGTITDHRHGLFFPMFAAGFFPPVNSTILYSLSTSYGSLFFNYFNATSPLNISITEYSYHSSHIKAYDVFAKENSNGVSNNSSQVLLFVRYQRIVIDAYSGVVLYLTYNETTANNQASLNVSVQLTGTNVPLGVQTNVPLYYVILPIIAILAVAIALLFLYRKRSKVTR